MSLLLVTCTAALITHDPTPSVETSQPYVEETQEPYTEAPTEESTEPSSEKYVPQKSDFSMKIKVLDKTVFSDGETWWQVRVTPEYAGADLESWLASIPDHGVVEITYKITGGNQDTVEFDLGTQKVKSGEEFVTTRTPSKPKASVTDVEYHEDW